jgi:cullin 1
MVKWMQRFFQYLDKFYVEMHSIAKLEDQGFKIFKEVVFAQIMSSVTEAVVETVRVAREGGEVEETQILKDTVRIYLKLSQDKLASDGSVPRLELDKQLIEETRRFYQQRSLQIIDNYVLIDYLKDAQKCYGNERHRVAMIFNWDVDQQILKTFRAEMLIKPQSVLLSKPEGFKEFVNTRNMDSLRLMYSLYKEEPDHLKPICDLYRGFVKE